MFKKALVLMLLLFATASINARIFKWVDEKGVTHYSESASPKQKATELPTEPAPSETQGTGINPETLRWQRQEAEFQKRKAEREAAEKIEELERKNARREAVDAKRKCIWARQQLFDLEKKLPVFSINEKGERVYWDDKFRAAVMEKRKLEIKTYCKQP